MCCRASRGPIPGRFAALAPTYITRPVLILLFMALALIARLRADGRDGDHRRDPGHLCHDDLAADRRHGPRRRTIPAGLRTINLREWFVVSLPIFLVESFFFILTNADVLMVGAYMDPDDVAVYFATVKTLALVHFVYFAVKAGVAQRYAQFTHGDPEKLAEFARETVAWTFWPSVVMAMVVLVLGEPMLVLFGPGFEAGYPLLFLLVLGVVARAAVGPCESLLTMSGNQNVCAIVYALTLVVNIGLSMVLIPHFGLWGAAIATAVSMTFEAAALSFTAWRKLGIAMVIFLPPTRTGKV